MKNVDDRIKQLLLEEHDKVQDALSDKDKKIRDLEGKLRITELESNNREKDIKTEFQLQLTELVGKLENEKNAAKNREADLKSEFEFKLKQKQDEVDYYKNLKTKMSTKMIGESFYVHCSTEFNRMRPLFHNAYFEKDNDASGGSKGEFVFRDFEDDQEYISIMFEMKK